MPRIGQSVETGSGLGVPGAWRGEGGLGEPGGRAEMRKRFLCGGGGVGGGWAVTISWNQRVVMVAYP